MDKTILKAESNLLRSAKASKLAYSDVHVRPWIKREVDMYMRLNMTQTDAHAYLWKTGDKSMIVSFRGTHNLKDFSNCMDIRQCRYSFRQYNVGVHNGVMKMFQSLEPYLTECFLENNIKVITFCGHSLGGSIATVAAAYYGSMFNNRKTISCHTFGAPKVGDKEFAQWFADSVNESIRVIIPGDLVTMLPPCIGKHGLRHAEDISVQLPSLTNECNPFVLHDLDTYIDQLCIPNVNRNV